MFRRLTDPMYGISPFAMFEGDPVKLGDDVGNPSDGNPGGGGGTPNADNKPAGGKSKDDDTPATHEVKVNGETLHLTLEEMTVLASKSAGADEKFQKAAKLTKDAEKGLELSGVLEELKTAEGDAQTHAMTKACNMLGIDMATVQQLTGGKPMDQTPDNKGKAPVEIKMDQLPEKAQKAIAAAEAAELKDIRQNIEESTKKGIDKDESLGKMISDLGGDDDKVKSVLYNMAIDEVQNRIVVRREQFGPDMIDAVVQKVRSTVKNLGIPAKATSIPPVLGIGPGEGYTPAVLSDKPIERVKSTDAAYDDNLAERYLQKQRMAMK